MIWKLIIRNLRRVFRLIGLIQTLLISLIIRIIKTFQIFKGSLNGQSKCREIEIYIINKFKIKIFI